MGDLEAPVTGGAFPRKVGGENRTVTAGRRPWWPRMAGLQPLSTRAFGPRLRRLTALTALATRPLIATKRSTVRCGQSVCKCHAEKFRSAIFARILTAVHSPAWSAGAVRHCPRAPALAIGQQVEAFRDHRAEQLRAPAAAVEHDGDPSLADHVPHFAQQLGQGFRQRRIAGAVVILSFPKIRSRRVRKVRQNQRIIVFDGCDAPLDCSSYCQPVQVAAPA